MVQEPTAGSLDARIIRACPVHAQCPLDCAERPVEDLGTIASFSNERKEDSRKWLHLFLPWVKQS
jgi:hypothetical protein